MTAPRFKIVVSTQVTTTDQSPNPSDSAQWKFIFVYIKSAAKQSEAPFHFWLEPDQPRGRVQSLSTELIKAWASSLAHSDNPEAEVQPQWT